MKHAFSKMAQNNRNVNYFVMRLSLGIIFCQVITFVQLLQFIEFSALGCLYITITKELLSNRK